LISRRGLITFSCGKDKDGDDDDNNGKPVEEETSLTDSNWQKVIRDIYGFDLNVPSGWTFKSGKKTNINPAYYVQFTTTAADFEAEYGTFMQYVFDLTAKVTPADGNFNMDMDDNYAWHMTDKLTEIPTMMGIPLPLWYFNTSKYAIQISLDDSETSKMARITLIAVKSIK
jgi:hypothetical protein